MYAKINGTTVVQYPYTIKNLKNDNPNTSFPKVLSADTLSAFNMAEVQQGDQPSYDDRTQTCGLAESPTLTDGVWFLNWIVSEKTADEIALYDAMAAGSARGNRDRLLAETDWWTLSDTGTMTAEQTAYRQALRDISSHANWPHLDEADWPTKP